MWALLNNALAFPKKKASRQVEFQVQIWTGVFPKHPCRKRNHRTHLKSSQLIWTLLTQRMLQTKTSIWVAETSKVFSECHLPSSEGDTLKLKGKHHLKSLNLKKIADLHARYAITQHHSMLNHIPNHKTKAKKTSAHPMAVGERTPEKTRMRIPGPPTHHSQHTPKRTPQTSKFDPSLHRTREQTRGNDHPCSASYIEVSALRPWPFPNTPSIDLSSFRGLQLSPTSQLAFVMTTKIESYYASSGETMRTPIGPISSENVKNSRSCIDHWAIPTPTSRSPSKSSRGA